MYRQVFNFVDPSTNDLVDRKKWEDDGSKGYTLSREYTGGHDTDLAKAVVDWQKPCGSRPYDETFERDTDTPNPEEESKKWYSNKWSGWKSYGHDTGRDNALVTDWSAWNDKQEACNSAGVSWSDGNHASSSSTASPGISDVARPGTGWSAISVVKSEADAAVKDSDVLSSTAVSDSEADHRPADSSAGTWGADYLAKKEGVAAAKSSDVWSSVTVHAPIAGHIPADAAWSDEPSQNQPAVPPVPRFAN